MRIEVSGYTKVISDTLVKYSIDEASYFPVDRFFLEKYIRDINSASPVEFIFYNFEQVNDLYTIQLFRCLPEIWERIKVDDLNRVIESFTNPFSFYTLIKFSYRYLEIDIIELVLKSKNVKENFYSDIVSYIKLQYNTFIKTPDELDTDAEELLGISNNQWTYVKQIFLADRRVFPACTTLADLENYINRLSKKYK
jgi:hypothetical protein